jgi:hypothetical protein
MTTRKPKLNLLYTADYADRWLQLAVVAPTPPSQQQQHARQWQAARFATSAHDLPALAPRLKH